MAERGEDGRMAVRESARRGAALRAVLPWIAPSLLVALALTQLVLAHTAHLSPWKGGGFGMFSTNDHGSFRTVRVVAIGARGEQVLPIPPELDRLRRAVRELPTGPRLLRLARALEQTAPEASALRVEIWRLEFAADDLRPERRKLTEAVLERRP